MILESPLCISARLMPAIKVGNAYISFDLDCLDRFHIDTPDWSETVPGFRLPNIRFESDIEMAREAFSAFLSFAAAMRYSDSDNRDLFQPIVREWLYEHEDEIAYMHFEFTGD